MSFLEKDSIVKEWSGKRELEESCQCKCYDQYCWPSSKIVSSLRELESATNNQARVPKVKGEKAEARAAYWYVTLNNIPGTWMFSLGVS